MMQGVLLDIDGVLLQNGRAIEGAAAALAWLNRQGIPYRCITNTTSLSAAHIALHCCSLGLSVPDEHIFNPTGTAIRWLRAMSIDRLRLLVPAGIDDEFAAFDCHSADPQAIVVGDVGERFSFATLNPLFRLLMDNPQLPLLALGMTRYFVGSSGLQMDAGPFIRALEYASGRPARVMGKPAAAVFEQALADMGVAASAAVMLGDDRQSDVLAAQQLGITGVLVQTGKYRPGDEQADTDGAAPQHVLASVAGLPEWLAG